MKVLMGGTETELATQHGAASETSAVAFVISLTYKNTLKFEEDCRAQLVHPLLKDDLHEVQHSTIHNMTAVNHESFGVHHTSGGTGATCRENEGFYII